MIIGRDIHPEKKAYYLGAKILATMQGDQGDAFDFFDIFRQINETNKVSMKLYALALDWLFILGVVESEEGCIKKCF